MATHNGASTNPLSQPALKRTIGFVLLTLYGLGTILGAGIYVLIGEVARQAGTAAPAAFVLSAVVAAFSALSYAEISGRLPKSAGEAAYVDAAFRLPSFAALTGWAVIGAGIVSSATLVRGFIGYLSVFMDLPAELVIVAVVGALGGLAVWGIAESMWVAGVITVIEATALLAVCVVARDSLGLLPERWSEMLPLLDTTAWAGVLSGSFIAFYAFIGFEDMVNVAEEVVEPERTLPRAIVAALILSTSLYVLVAVTASLALPTDLLMQTDAPMAAIVESRGISPAAISLVGLFAVINGALIQLIMASRVLYGLGAQGLAWRGFARVHARRRTPVVATVVSAVAILSLSLTLSLGHLAQFTSFIALSVFAVVNLSLIRLKRLSPRGPVYTVPGFVPVIGAALCIAMLLFQITAVLGSWVR